MINFGNIKTKMNIAYSSDLVNGTEHHKKIYEEYLNTIKSSPILMLEYVIYENLKKNGMTYDESLRFIDENLVALSKINSENLLSENNKLKKFDLPNIEIDKQIHSINNSIFNLINESVVKKTLPNINKIHESVNNLVKNLTKEILTEEKIIYKNVDINTIFKIAKQKLQENLSEMDEDKLKIINAFIIDDQEKLKNIFEDYKINTKKFLNETSEISEDVKSQALLKVENLIYDKETFIDNINKLFEIKNLSK